MNIGKGIFLTTHVVGPSARVSGFIFMSIWGLHNSCMLKGCVIALLAGNTHRGGPVIRSEPLHPFASDLAACLQDSLVAALWAYQGRVGHKDDVASLDHGATTRHTAHRLTHLDTY